MYKLPALLSYQTEQTSVIRTTDMASIPFDPANTDYQAYLKWLEESPDNQPLPAEETI
jgi:hypothetical protein